MEQNYSISMASGLITTASSNSCSTCITCLTSIVLEELGLEECNIAFDRVVKLAKDALRKTRHLDMPAEIL